MIQQYCIGKYIIDGLETYIVSPETYSVLLADTDFLTAIDVTKITVERHVNMIQRVNCFDLFLAFIHYEGRKKYKWFPIICWKYENNYYHVLSLILF